MREAPPSTPAPPRPPLKPPARNRQQRAPCHPCHCGTSAGESKASNDAQLPNERRRPLRLASPSQPAPISLSVHTLVVAALAAAAGRPKPTAEDEPACSRQRATICSDQCPSARFAPTLLPALLASVSLRAPVAGVAVAPGRPKPAPQQTACHEKTQKKVGGITINNSLAPVASPVTLRCNPSQRAAAARRSRKRNECGWPVRCLAGINRSLRQSRLARLRLD
jgi:hypothetical protein